MWESSYGADRVHRVTVVGGEYLCSRAFTHKRQERLLIKTAAPQSWLQTRHSIEGVKRMSCAANTSTPQHPGVRLGPGANSGFKISISGLTRGSCECEAKNKLLLR